MTKLSEKLIKYDLDRKNFNRGFRAGQEDMREEAAAAKCDLPSRTNFSPDDAPGSGYFLGVGDGIQKLRDVIRSLPIKDAPDDTEPKE